MQQKLVGKFVMDVPERAINTWSDDRYRWVVRKDEANENAVVVEIFKVRRF